MFIHIAVPYTLLGSLFQDKNGLQKSRKESGEEEGEE